MIIALPVALLLFLSIVLTRRSHGERTRPSLPPPDRHRLDLGTSQARGSIRALARIEAFRLIRHPAFIGVGLLSAVLATFTGSFAGDANAREFAMFSGLFVWPLAAGTMISSSLAVRRGMRDGADQMLDVTAMSPGARTLAHLLAIGSAVVVAVILVGASATAIVVNDGTGWLDLWELTHGPISVAGAGALGVLSARIFRGDLGWLAGLTLVAAFQLGLASIQPEYNRLRWLAPWVSPDQFLPGELNAGRDPGWHAGYLLGLVGLIGILAVARHARGRHVMTAAVLAGSLVATTAIAQTRPLTGDQARAVADAITAARTVCYEEPSLRICLPARAEAHLPTVVSLIRSVRDLAPAADVETLTVIARPASTMLRALPPEVLRLLPAAYPDREPFVWPDDGTIGMDQMIGSIRNDREVQLAVALRVASRMVGLPVEPGARVATTQDETRLLRHPVRVGAEPSVVAGRPTMLRCVSAGQARAVIALWLAGAASPHARLALSDAGAAGNDFNDDGISPAHGTGPIPTDTHALLFIEPPLWTADLPSGSLWAASDLRVAEQLLARPPAAVSSALAPLWERMTDPSATTGDLIAALRLDPAPALAGAGTHVEPTCA